MFGYNFISSQSSKLTQYASTTIALPLSFRAFEFPPRDGSTSFKMSKGKLFAGLNYPGECVGFRKMVTYMLMNTKTDLRTHAQF